jgi:hypothetical protein
VSNSLEVPPCPKPRPAPGRRMLSGRRLDLLDPTPVDIEIEDIAHGLAFVARWNGQTRGDFPYSVAEHSLLVEDIHARLQPGRAGEMAARGAAPRRAGIRDRGHDFAGEGRRRARVRGTRRPPGRGDPPALRASRHSAENGQDRRSRRPIGSLPGWRLCNSPGFPGPRQTASSVNPREAWIDGLTLRLRPPADVRADFLQRHAALMAAL